MEEQLITFYTAKVVKEKGCKLKLFGKGFTYTDEKGNKFWTNIWGGISGNENTKPVLNCTQSLLQKWLRREHDVFISINTTSEYFNPGGQEGDDEYLPIHKYRIIKNIDNYKYDVIDWSESYEFYEEALEKGIQKAIKLI